MPPMDHRIPITVLTGFLGSGKTTLLNTLLRQAGMKDTAVIINEIGETGLDHILARSVEDTYIADNTVLLGSGCLCCILRTELADALRDLFFKRTLLAIPTFDRLIIETTGLADPGPILANLLNADVIRDHYRLDAVAVTVDSVHGLQQLETHAEARKQAAVADVLLLTKSDLAEDAAVTQLSARLQALNPGAAQYRIRQGCIDAACIVGVGLFDQHSALAQPQRWLRAPTTPRTAVQGRHQAVHDDTISTCTIELPAPPAWARLEPRLQALCKAHGAHLLRLKGIIYASDQASPMAVHAVQHTLYPPTFLEGWHEPHAVSRLVLIGQSLDPAEIRQALIHA